MIVMKFGGSSVANADRIRKVAKIVAGALKRRPVLVVSAHGHVTDMLIETGRMAALGKVDTAPVRKVHADILRGLKLDPKMLDPVLDEFETLLKGISLVREATPKSMDYVLSFGERLSARSIAAFLSKHGVPATPADAYDIGMVTSSDFGSATPLLESEAIIDWTIKKYDTVPVVTGFIGKNKLGNITTLGRNGSDYTAAIVGAAIGAEEIQLWSDVDGIMSADPTVVKTATPIDKLSFDEASELAYYGGRLHPYTLAPAVRKNIPIRILNTFSPEKPGTLILSECRQRGSVKAIAYKSNLFLINIISSRMLFHHGFMSRIFEIFNKHAIVIDMIATSEVSVSLTTDNDRNLDAAVKELSEFSEVTIEPDKAIVCVVGEGIRHTAALNKVFNITEKEKVPVHMVSHSAHKINIAFLTDSKTVGKAVNALHAGFFRGKQ